jgi:hypothetical protein
MRVAYGQVILNNIPFPQGLLDTFDIHDILMGD